METFFFGRLLRCDNAAVVFISRHKNVAFCPRNVKNDAY